MIHSNHSSFINYFRILVPLVLPSFSQVVMVEQIKTKEI